MSIFCLGNTPLFSQINPPRADFLYFVCSKTEVGTHEARHVMHRACTGFQRTKNNIINVFTLKMLSLLFSKSENLFAQKPKGGPVKPGTACTERAQGSKGQKVILYMFLL